ncbi:hypothetical protein ALC60_11101 [Trachymyrmex zeteki]|uniref:Uncharacterized protein n=1 Tax=Mycetomoellerius zeteki TaxID=64791 RepID=A0A151WPJ1_9HYME|nr:hypothetical protein ALC60_11101 [Trachymyrmex zeteki]
MTLKDNQKFERLNAVSINVYGIENKQILLLRLTSDKKEKHVNVLYLQDPRDDSLGHFAWIKNLSRLVSSQLNRKKNKKFFCNRTSEKLELHAMDCRRPPVPFWEQIPPIKILIGQAVTSHKDPPPKESYINRDLTTRVRVTDRIQKSE